VDESEKEQSFFGVKLQIWEDVLALLCKMVPMVACGSFSTECYEVCPARVLIVDDHVDTVEVIQMLLARAGYDVRTACSGAEALSIASQFTPDLGVLDIRLPDMTGYDLALRLRAAAGPRGLRLIALSSFLAPDHRLAERFDEVVRKPIGGFELQRLLRRLRPR
jgi:CheY-like chemotaxis protein